MASTVKEVEYFYALVEDRPGEARKLAMALGLGAAATWLLHPALGSLTWLFPVTLGHFFLFCNVFSVRRSFELIWAAVFVANVGAWLLAGELRWSWVLAIQTPLTLLLILLERRIPR